MASNSPAQTSHYRAQEIEGRDSAPLVTYCGLCDRVLHRGRAGEGREIAREHRAERHPEIRPRRRRQTRSLMLNRQHDMDSEHRAEIEAARRRRALLTGVELE